MVTGTMYRRALLALAAVSAAAAVLALLLPGTSSAADPVLNGVVGPGFTITLVDANGNTVSHLDPGAYTINVQDKASEHNFHLQGPGVDQKTSVDAVENVTWSVTFTDGTYTFVCDVHASMNGSFTVGTVQPPPPPPPPAKPGTLKGTVGPGFTISLKTKAGKRVTKVKAGKYKIAVADKASIHNFHLYGPGLSKKTGIPFKGSVTWTVTFKRGKTYRYRCDVHRTTMRGSFKGV
jgi:plastocyanin